MSNFMVWARIRIRAVLGERGANLVEYILLVALIALAVIAAVIFLRGEVTDKFNETGSKIAEGGCGVIVPVGLIPVPTPC